MRRLAAGIALSLSMFACASEDVTNPNGQETAPATAEQQATAAGRVGTHNQVVVGTPGDAIISHIPMFQQPHDVQCIVSGSFTATDGHTLPPSFGDTEYTFAPGSASLDALRTGSLGSLTGTLFMGNMEAGGRPVAQVKFTVSRVVHQHLLEQNAARGDLSYFLASAGGATYAFHHITASPSFDDILRVDISGSYNGEEATLRGVSDDSRSRLSVAGSGTATVNGQTLPIRSVKALSCLPGPDFFGNCH